MSSSKSVHLASILKKEKCAVLVIDKQVGYIDEDQPLIRLHQTNTSRLRSTIDKLDDFIEEARKLHIPFIWTQMVENRDESPENISLKMKQGDTPAIIKTGDKSFEIYGRVHPLPDEKQIVKYRYDAFINTDLDQYLKSKGRSTVILTGAYASRCVLATSFVGSSLGYNVVWAGDLIGVPAVFEKELPVAMGLVDSILGYIFDSQALLDFWQNSSHQASEATVK